jgi:hypothetical protein
MSRTRSPSLAFLGKAPQTLLLKLSTACLFKAVLALMFTPRFVGLVEQLVKDGPRLAVVVEPLVRITEIDLLIDSISSSLRDGKSIGTELSLLVERHF